MKRGFTLIELVVAIAILVIISSFAGAIFSTSIDAHRTAMANAEIMRKLRAITDQLNADFRGLRKDGEIFVVWIASPGDVSLGDPDRDIRLDRIMFFANGDFAAYNDPYMRGNLARISYMLSNGGSWAEPVRPIQIPPNERILARTQHILTQHEYYPDFVEPNQLNDADLNWWRNAAEADKTTMQQWVQMSWNSKQIALSTETDIIIGDAVGGGAFAVPSNPSSIPMFFCQGVGEFKIQGWYDAGQRWVPSIAAGDFDGFAGGESPGVLYPYPRSGAVVLGGEFAESNYQDLLNENNFNKIPGLGRSLKFTFTLYDSKGVIKDGKTFTHIVYLDN
jgi:prepilin-type N-terminal cleavage/methylation domain-containing protein